MVSLHKIINESSETEADLLKLARAIDVEVNQIDYKQRMKKSADYAILNMGTPAIGGTHWIGVSNKHKLYFDPLGLPRPMVIPRDYRSIDVNIQDYRYGHCGAYVMLWLWYLQHAKLSDFYKLFTVRQALI